MRPIRLVMRAFGPFAEAQTIDFRELEHRAFFLISGPTGAGKTTLLDAMCYGLYGESTGALRQAEHFRSDHAVPSAESEVVFDFSIGAERYRVQRKPRQERAKKRGEGTTTITAEASLWRRTDCSGDEEEGEPLATQPGKVTARVESLLGFGCAQFRQVVVLPQGEFRRLLTADSSEREAILERVFDVAHYQDIQIALKQSADALTKQHARLFERHRLLLEQAESESLDALDLRIRAGGEALAEARAERDRLAEARNEAARALERARALDRDCRQRDQTARDFAELDARRAEFENKSAALDAAHRAEPVREKDAERAKRAAEAEAARRTRGEREIEARERAAALQRAEAAHASEFARAPEREAADTRLHRLESLYAGAAALDAARKDAAAALRAFEQAEAARQQRAAALDGVSAEQAKRRAERDRLRASAEDPMDAVRELERLEDALRLAEKRIAAQAKRDATEALWCSARDEAAAGEAARAQSEAGLAELRDAARRGRAVLVAAQLRPGEPCPVCGSCAHPAPAHAESALEVPDDATIASAEQALGHATEAARRAGGQVDELARERAALDAEIAVHLEGLRSRWPAVDDHSPEAGVAALTTELEAARARRQRSDARRQEIEAHEAALRDLAEHEAATREQLEAALRERSGCAEALKSAEAVLAERESALPSELREPGALEAALRVAGAERDTLVAALESARLAASRADAEASEAAGLLEAARAGERESVSHLEEAEAGFELARAGAGFADRAELRAASLEPDAKQALDAELRAYRDARAAARDARDRALAAAGEAKRPDLSAHESAHVEASARLSQADVRLGELGSEAELRDQWRSALAALEAELAGLDARYAALGQVARTANGENPERLTFQRFVLAAFLDEVLSSASQLLRDMSKGRFVLRRAQSVADRRRGAGLDLVVDDASTGRERPVATLSGGESFLAALALALGLAQVVQHHAGGIRLEAIFIDEGFGSLDESTLDDAVGTLMALQGQGGRMVGVISHVGELRERIDTRLEIRTERSGSRASFVLGG